MRIFNQLDEWMHFRTQLAHHHTLGFVPTMGNLHPGHASLFEASMHANEFTVSSLFINPTQFNQEEDFNNYPRTLEQDLELMDATGVDYCILPNAQEMYADKFCYQVHENQLSQLMEGAHRPGHFNGVLTVVLKLLHLTKPTRAYFGEKDYQQYELIRKMTKALFMDVTIEACPTVRESSGLAYSSRNNRLSTEQKKLAEQFATIFHQPQQSCAAIIEQLKALGIQVEYIEEYQNRRYAAVLIGSIRLIDNFRMP